MSRRLVVLTIAALTAAIIGLTVALIVVASDEEGPATQTAQATHVKTMPNVVHRTVHQADVILGFEGFNITFRPVRSTSPRGTVLRLDPPPGTVVHRPSKVTVIYSGGRSY